MKELESKLRKVPLKAPSQGLDGRVAAQKPEHATGHFPGRRGVPVWVAVTVALITAMVGFAIGQAWRGEPPGGGHVRPRPVMIHVIYNSPSSGNPFDFTRACGIFPDGEMETTIQTQKGA